MMRSSTDIGPRRIFSSRRRVIIVVAVIILIVLLFSLRSLAFLWTDQLWFSSEGLSPVFSTLLEIKVGLAVVFGAVFFVLLFGNLLLTDRLSAHELSFDAEDELVRRFQAVVRPYSRRVYALVSIVAAVIAGLTATGQWQNYLLFSNYQPFHVTDPLFHKDIAFYVFELPFMTFVIDWLLGALIVVILMTTFFHYLNGGIRPSRSAPRVAASVKVHLSVLLAAVAVVKALGYLIAKWQLVTSTNGYVNGAGYADVHARMPALTILFVLSLAAAAILLFNLRSRSWTLPMIALGLWLFVAVAIGYIYPAAYQALKVTPAQSSLELPYIQRNINATLAAYGLTHVATQPFADASSLTPTQVASASQTLANIRLWDPSSNISLATVQHTQGLTSYYEFTTLAVNRYVLNGKLTPVLVGVRQVNQANLPASTWVNEHLEYTHGVGVIVLVANQNNANGTPVYALKNVPPQASEGVPRLTENNIYFGINMPGWVIADTNQQEFDYKNSNGTPVYSHYTGGGGVAAGGFFRRAAFALRFDDLNTLISSQITSSSRIIFVRDVQQMAEKAAPFLSWSNQPYPVFDDGQLYYVLDGFTTTDEYPYSQNADTQTVPYSGGLPSNYNYVRNSVKLLVNAYTGQMTFYAWDPSDPILQAYRSAFPNMFKPASSFPQAILPQLEYPSQLFAIEAAIYGRYHITVPSSFYNASNGWTVSPTNGEGSANQTLQRAKVQNNQGTTQGNYLPMDPQYEVEALPGTKTQQLVLATEYIPTGSQTSGPLLDAFLTVTSDPGDYGQLNLYTTISGQTKIGPVQADAQMLSNSKVSEALSLLGRNGSKVLLGNNLLVPVADSVLYVRPLYVTSAGTQLPGLRDVIVDFNSSVGFATTLSAALDQALHITSTGPSPPPSHHETVAQYLAAASNEYSMAESALTAGNLAAYQADVNAMNKYIADAQSALAAAK